MTNETAGYPPIWTERGGDGAPLLVLVHGLGANGAVWERLLPIVRARWPGRWLNLDLRGHGRSPHGGPYGYALHAADVARAVGEQDAAVSVIGHSMGGVVGMALATGWFGVTVGRVLAFGVKIAWAEGEAAKLKQIAAAPARRFATREEAADRYLKVSGLVGLVAPDAPETAVGVRAEDGGFHVAADPGIYAAAGPEVAPFYRAATAPVRLAAGDGDPMVTEADMKALDPDAVVVPGAGHNLHVERPDVVWDLFAALG